MRIHVKQLNEYKEFNSNTETYYQQNIEVFKWNLVNISRNEGFKIWIEFYFSDNSWTKTSVTVSNLNWQAQYNLTVSYPKLGTDANELPYEQADNSIAYNFAQFVLNSDIVDYKMYRDRIYRIIDWYLKSKSPINANPTSFENLIINAMY